MSRRTREGHPVIAADAQVREAVKPDTLCKTCIHFADLCENIPRVREPQFVGNREYVRVVQCNGYEKQ